MIVSWVETAWEDNLCWQTTDKKTVKRINVLIKSTAREPCSGLGDPQPLKYHWSGYCSRRINREHRLVYKVTDTAIIIVQCRYHY